MYTKRVFKLKQMVIWTRYETLFFLLVGIFWVGAYVFFNLDWLRIPWTPITLIGTAVAFIVGFQNNAVYDRIWEARKIWGGIVNTSRTLGIYVQDMVTNEYAETAMAEQDMQKERRILIYRHIAWMTALRHAMRSKKGWETSSDHKTNKEWGITTPENKIALKEDLAPYLSKADLDHVLSMDNKQTALLYLQSRHLRSLKEKGALWEFSFLQIEAVLQELFTLQGQTERIKNFPYPRQYATLNHYFMWLLLMLLPLALVPQFLEIGKEIALTRSVMGPYFIWAAVPIYAIVAWIFHTMERIGKTGENPFEGTANDVPISTIARGIEIDLRQNLGEDKTTIPLQYEAELGVQF